MLPITLSALADWSDVISLRLEGGPKGMVLLLWNLFMSETLKMPFGECKVLRLKDRRFPLSGRNVNLRPDGGEMK